MTKGHEKKNNIRISHGMVGGLKTITKGNPHYVLERLGHGTGKHTLTLGHSVFLDETKSGNYLNGHD